MSARCMPDADARRDAPDATRRSSPRQARNVECFHQLTLTHFRLAHYKSQIKSLFTKYYRDFRFRNPRCLEARRLRKTNKIRSQKLTPKMVIDKKWERPPLADISAIIDSGSELTSFVLFGTEYHLMTSPALGEDY
uniref:SFRICE_035490 n=1 Tax=Spodoptera frugiperda TaxID=7108 RepID=A0A2H1WHG1_SPOFR